jgi:hypothetical protein
MPLIVRNGVLLRKGNQLAASTGCCCKSGGPCASQCSGAGVPATITFTVSNFAGLTFSSFNPNGLYVLPNAYAIYGNCYYYAGQFNPFTPACSFPYSLAGELFQADILVFPNSVAVKFTERTGGTCVGDRQFFNLGLFWDTTLCGRPTGFPLAGTATTATAYYGLMSFDWSIDL